MSRTNRDSINGTDEMLRAVEDAEQAPVDFDLEGAQGDGNEVHDAPPETIGKYSLQRELGKGNCGLVYLAYDPFVDRQVAVKVGLTKPAGQSGDVDFLIEARAAGRLNHPNIVGVYDAGVENGRPYIVMEYVDGLTLGEHSDKTLPPSRVVEIAYDCAQALAYAHRLGVLHRDIKPDNVILNQAGTAKLMDFSIAAIMQNQKVRPGSILGTPRYMAPEQIAGTTIGPSADLYSLGAVMFRLLTGETPHTADNQTQLLMRIQCEPARSLASVRPDLPDRLCAIVDRLLQMDPARRYDSGAKLAEDLVNVWDRRSVRSHMTHPQAENILAGLGFCTLMTPSEMDELLTIGTLQDYDKGQLLLRQGVVDERLRVLVSGTLYERTSPPIVLRAGDAFGTFALPGLHATEADVVAVSPSLVLEVARDDLDRCSANCRYRVFQAAAEALFRRATSAD